MKNKELANHFYKKRKSDSPGFQRLMHLSSDKISMSTPMLKDSIKIGFEPVYLMADSWFMYVIPLCIKNRGLK